MQADRIAFLLQPEPHVNPDHADGRDPAGPDARPGRDSAAEVVEGVPSPIKEGVSKEDAESVKKQIEEVGGSVELK